MEIPCVVKLYYSQDNSSYTRGPKEHSCRLSLQITDSLHHIVVDSKTGLKRYPLRPECVADIVTRRIDDGCLTVAFKPGYMLDQLVVSRAEDKRALKTYADGLEKLCFAGTKRHVPLSPPVTPEREQSGGGHSAKRKLSLHLPSRPTLPSGEISGLKPAQFYSPSVLPSAVPSLLPSPQKSLTPVNYRRSLVAPSDVLTTTPSKPAVKRLPLAVLSEPQGAAKKPRVFYPPGGDLEELEGFANLGNTCYMNAVLQSLLGLEPFAEDLYNQTLVRKVSPKSLYMTLYLLLKSKRAKESFESQRILLTNIKQIIAQTAAKFSGSRQQDAHELLAQCLDQLKQDTDKIDGPGEAQGDKGQTSLSPVVRNFECEIMHTIRCKGCGKITQKPEIIYDFALQLPKSVILKLTEQANLQQLFDLYFASEDVEYNCSVCGNKMATLSHQLSKLPRVLIIYLKRYGFNAHACKRIDSIHIPRFINAGPCCVDDVGIPCEYTGPWPRDMVEVLEGKENVIIPDVQVENRNGTPAKATTPSRNNAAMSEAAPVREGVATYSSHTHGSGPITTSPLFRDTATPTATPTTPQPSLRSSGYVSSASQNGGDGDADVSIISSVDISHDDVAMSIDPLDFPTPTKMDCSDNLSDTAKEIQRPGDLARGVPGGVASKGLLPSLRRFPYSKRVKRDNARAVVSEIVDDLHSISEGIDEQWGLEETPTALLGDTPSEVREGSVTTPSPLRDRCHSNGLVSNGGSLELHSNGYSWSGDYTSNGCDAAARHVTTNGHGPVGHMTNGGNHMTNSYSHASGDSHPSRNGCGSLAHNDLDRAHVGLGTTTVPPRQREDGDLHVGLGTTTVPRQREDGGLHVMDLEEEENELLKQALEESTRLQPAELVRLQELGMTEEDQLKLALELSIQDSSLTEEMAALPAASSDMPPVCGTPDPQAQAHTFRLMSIVNHIGKGSGGGHYITDVNCVRDGTWKSFNDSVVVEMKEEDIRQRRQCSGYIFFYMYKLTYQSVVQHTKPS